MLMQKEAPFEASTVDYEQILHVQMCFDAVYHVGNYNL